MDPSSTNDHQLFATTNFSKSGASGLYDRARPTYPAPVHAHLLDLLQSAPPSGETTSSASTATAAGPAHVVELGAGTGLFTRGFLRAAGVGTTATSAPTVNRLTAVEPSEGMRQGFDRALAADPAPEGTKVVCVDGTFERVPVGDGEADLVVIAQAFHWTGTTQLPAVREIARILKPGGAWCLVWNLEDRAVPWVAQLRDAYEKFEKDTPQYRLGLWRAMYDQPEYHELFTEPTHHKFHQTLHTTEDLAVDRVLSKSYITALAEPERLELDHQLRQTLRRGDGRVWVDQAAGVFEYLYETDFFVARRK